MTTDEPVVHLPEKDAIALLHLLRGFERLLREGRLEDSDQRLVTGGVDLDALGKGPWRERMADEAAAAYGLLRQSLDGYDASAVISRARPDEGTPSSG